MKPSVLVVDDDLPILKLIEIVLSRESLNVVAVSSGSAAIERLTASDYAAIVLDLTMPNVSGFEVIAHLRKSKPELLPRVIVITAMTDSAIRGLDRSLVHEVLAKPFDNDRLLGSVLECTRIRAAERIPIKAESSSSTASPASADHPSASELRR